jgi:hypothetical protein
MTCENCPNRAECKQVCKEMQAYLSSQGIYRADWIRPVGTTRDKEGRQSRYSREINMPLECAEILALGRIYGKKRKKFTENP